MRADIATEARGGLWPWILQRVTAVILLFGLGIHLVVGHLFGLGHLDYNTILERVSGWFFTGVDVTLLGASLFHGLNGLRMVLLDYGFTAERRRVLDAALWLVGIAAFVYGIWALWPWISH